LVSHCIQYVYNVPVLEHGSTDGKGTIISPTYIAIAHVWDRDSLNIFAKTQATAADNPVITTKLPVSFIP
jgi:hypothetical protein